MDKTSKDKPIDVSMKVVAKDRQAYLPLYKGRLLEIDDFLGKKQMSFSVPRSLKDRFLEQLAKPLFKKYGLSQTPAHGQGGYFVPPEYEPVLQYLFDQGVIASPEVHFSECYNDIPKFISTYLPCASVKHLTDGNEPNGYAFGVGVDAEESVGTLIGEVLERFPLLLYRQSELVQRSVAQLDRQRQSFLHPKLLAGFSEEQKNRSSRYKWDDDSVFSWVSGKSLMSKRKAYLPAQLVFWNYAFPEYEPKLQQPITNGAAGYFTKTGALLNGLYELIERDGFFLHWLGNIPPPKIKLSSITDESLQSLFAKFARYRLPFDVLDITTDLKVPSYAVVIQDETPGMPAIAVAGSAHHTAEKAIHSALVEAWSLYSHNRKRIAEDVFELPDAYEPFSEGINRSERLQLWSNPAMKEKFMPFLKGDYIDYEQSPGAACSKLFKEDSEDVLLEQRVEQFAKKGKGYEIFYYETNNEIVSDVGFSSVKVIIPALLPLYLREEFAPLGAQRLQEFAQKNNCSSFVPNPLPHPFP